MASIGPDGELRRGLEFPFPSSQKEVPPSSHRAQVVVQPVEGFLDQFSPRNVVTGFVLNAALVFLGGTQEAEHRELRGFHGVEEIETTVQHQDRDLHPRREVKFVHFR